MFQPSKDEIDTLLSAYLRLDSKIHALGPKGAESHFGGLAKAIEAPKEVPLAKVIPSRQLFLPCTGPFEGRHVEFLHLQKSPGDAGALLGGACHQRGQFRRHDLPRESEPVLEPAALLGLRHRAESFSQK